MRELVSLMPVSHRFLALINRILHDRFLASATLGGCGGLALECYHPLSSATQPFTVWSYRGTAALLGARPHGEEYCVDGELKKLGLLYSRFKPLDRHHYANLWIVGRGSLSSAPAMLLTAPTAVPSQPPIQPGTSLEQGSGGDTGSQDNRFLAADTITLETFESFSQLCVNVSLLNGGRFMTSTTITADTIRLSREWLDERALSSSAEIRPAQIGDSSGPSRYDPRVKWTDKYKDSGLKIHVRKHGAETTGLENDDLPTKYDIGIEGESVVLLLCIQLAFRYSVTIELFIRTGRLALQVERATEIRARCSRMAVFMTSNGVDVAAT
jgi:hypothetical protein